MDDIQQEYRQRMTAILSLSACSKVKSLLLQSLNQEMRDLLDLSLIHQLSKCRAFEVMSTSYSECPSTNYQMQKDVEELQEKIIKMRMVKFQSNEDIETFEEELFEVDKIVKARSEYHEHLKKKIDCRMEFIQNGTGSRCQKPEKEKSVLNKSLDTVAGILKFSKWWG